MLHHLVAPGFGIGGFGVDIFFVLSGFLITSLLAQEWQNTNRISLRRFYMRRILRLAPALILSILTAFTIVQLLGYTQFQAATARGALSSMLYISNWVTMEGSPYGLGPFGVHWSLSVEDQFYLIWPIILIFMLTKCLSKQKILAVISLGILCSASLCYPIWKNSEAVVRVWAGTDTRAQTLLIGCALGLLYTWGKLPDAKIISRLVPWALILMGAFLVAISYSPFDHFYIVFLGGYALFALCTATFIAYLLVVPKSLAHSLLSWKPLVWIGRISYGLYLWHGIFFWFIQNGNANWPQPVMMAVQVGLSFAAATVSYYLVERHFLKLKSRYESSSPTPQPTAAQPLPEFSRPTA